MEEGWLECSDPWLMLELLGDKMSDRKRRLFACACACARNLWDRMADDRLRDAVEVGEHYADRTADESERADWFQSMGRAIELGLPAGLGAWFRCAADLVRSRVRADAIGVPAYENPNRGWQCATLRDLVGNPFGIASLNPAWQTSAVVGLVQAAYEERILPSGLLDPDRLAVLADALEDAGCNEAMILDHLRGPGHHVHGCHVVDLILDRT